MDGYGAPYPGQQPPYPPPPGQPGPDYNQPQMQRPPSQSNAQSPHPGKTQIFLHLHIIFFYFTTKNHYFIHLSSSQKKNFCKYLNITYHFLKNNHIIVANSIHYVAFLMHSVSVHNSI